MTTGCLLLMSLVAGGCARTAEPDTPLPIDRRFGEGGDSPGQFQYPRAIDADDTTLWVVDKLARVQRVDARTGESLGWWRMPQWKLGKPTGVTAWTPKGDGDLEFVFVPDTHYHRVLVYSVDRDPRVGQAREGSDGALGTVVAEFGQYGEKPGQFTYPTDVAVEPNASGRGVARVFVSEYGGKHHRISIFERVNAAEDGAGGEYRFAQCFGKFGLAGENDLDGSLVFNRPQSIEIDERTGELIVADACNHRVGRLTKEGQLIAWYGCATGSARGDAPEMAGQPRMLYPYGLELPGDGTALLCEFGGARLHRVDLATGKSLGTYGTMGRKDGELITPWGVAVAHGEAYVLDSGNNRVQVFEVPRAERVAAGGSGGEGAARARSGTP